MNKTPTRASIGRAVVGLFAVAAGILKFAAVAGAAGMIWIHLCGSYAPGSGTTGGTIGVATSGASHSGVSTPFQCPSTPTGSANGMEHPPAGRAEATGGRGTAEPDDLASVFGRLVLSVV